MVSNLFLYMMAGSTTCFLSGHIFTLVRSETEGMIVLTGQGEQVTWRWVTQGANTDGEVWIMTSQQSDPNVHTHVCSHVCINSLSRQWCSDSTYSISPMFTLSRSEKRERVREPDDADRPRGACDMEGGWEKQQMLMVKVKLGVVTGRCRSLVWTTVQLFCSEYC